MNRDLALTEAERSWPIDRFVPVAETHAPGGHAPTLDFGTLVRIIREWRWLILGALALGLAFGVIYTLLSTPLYRSWVTLEVNPPTVPVTDEKNGESSATPNTWELVATQVGLLKSRSLAERVAQDLNLPNAPNFIDQSADAAARLKTATDKIAAGLDVVPPDEGTLIRFNYVSPDPQIAAEVANGIAEAFINSTLQRRFEASAYARKFLEQQIAKTRGDLERSERQLVAYAQAEGIINTNTVGGEGGAGTTSLQGESLAALNKALSEATARRVAAEGAYQAARSAGMTAEETTSTQALRQTRAALEAEYQDKRTIMKPEHPDMLSLRSRIDELDRQIARERSTVVGARSNSLLAEYRAALAAERALQGRVSQLKGAVLDLRGRSIQYTILQREVDTNRALYDALLQRYKQIGVAGGIGAAPVSIVDRAEVPTSPFKPRLVVNMLVGTILGLLAGIAAAVGLEFLNDTIKTREDVRKKLALACLGSIPRRSGKEPFLDDLRDPSSEISEAYSTVVASLRFSTERGVPKTLLVTSARAGEGKSSSALALAQNFARRDSSVLLVDADLRKPAFKSASDRAGLSKLLTTDDSLGAHVSATQYEKLWLLPSGPLPPNPADLLSTGRFQAILREAAAQFDIVIIDAPPVLGLADAPLLASACTDVMFVVESGKTRTSGALEAISRLNSAGAHILGVTLTKSTEEARTYGYGYSRYGYNSLDKKRTEIAMIAHQADG